MPVDAEKAARIEREMEKLRRRRERREERRRQPLRRRRAAVVAPPPREIEVGSKVVLEGQQTPAWCSRSKATRCRWPSASC